MNNSLGGFEFLSCIPGTVGGGIKMNAGCFSREFKDILISNSFSKKIQLVLMIFFLKFSNIYIYILIYNELQTKIFEI